MKFRLLSEDPMRNKVGVHRVGDRRYHPGDIVESNERLDTKFKGKFEQVDDHTLTSTGEKVRMPGQTRPAIPTPGAVMEKGAGERDASAPSVLGAALPPAFNTETTAKKNEDTQKPPKKSKHGVDVTDEFPDAQLAKLKVFHDVKQDRYIVVDPEKDEVLKRAASEKPVIKFLKSQIA